jgi:hypothetical protein
MIMVMLPAQETLDKRFDRFCKNAIGNMMVII